MLFWEPCNINWNLNIISYKPFWLLSYNSKIRWERGLLSSQQATTLKIQPQTSQTTNKDFDTSHPNNQSNIESSPIDWLNWLWCPLICFSTAALQDTQRAANYCAVKVQLWFVHHFVDLPYYYALTTAAFVSSGNVDPRRNHNNTLN